MTQDKMAKARAAKKPPQYKNIHPDIKAIPDEDAGSVKTVKEWEVHNKDRVKEIKYKLRRMDKGKEMTLLERELGNREVYLANINRYWDTGEWLDLFYGKDQEHKTTYRTIAYAYDKDGYIKTTPSITN